VSERPARLAPRDLVATMLLVGPLLIALSVGWAYLIAGRAFRPLDRMVDQVKAITDGRSLHRRLAIGSAGTELVRLAVTLNEMIERLETSFAALRRFTADASHELKTPLAVLRADVERAMSPTTRRDERAIALEEALEQVTRMAELVNSLLTLARADEGRLEVVQDAIVLDDLAREVVETARLLGEEAGVQIDATEIATGGGARRPDAIAAAVPEPGHQRHQVHAARRHRHDCAGASWARRRISACATPASASRPPICPTSSIASGGRTGRARARPSAAASGWGWRSASGSRTPTGAPSPCSRDWGGAARLRPNCRWPRPIRWRRSGRAWCLEGRWPASDPEAPIAVRPPMGAAGPDGRRGGGRTIELSRGQRIANVALIES
jgi:hypothetical protein